MSTQNVAQAYAEAFFSLAEESDILDDICFDLASVSDIFEKNPEFMQLLSSPMLSKEEKLEVIGKVFIDDGSILYDFLCLLTERGRIAYITEIEKLFRELYNKKNNIEEVTVVTSVALSDDERCRLIVKLQNKLSKRIKLIEKIDKDLIGGVQLYYDDTLIDNSIATRINSITKELEKPID